MHFVAVEVFETVLLKIKERIALSEGRAWIVLHEVKGRKVQ